MKIADITSIITLLFGFVGLCITIHKAFTDLKQEIASMKVALCNYVTTSQCHQNRANCPCVRQMESIQKQAMEKFLNERDED